MCERHKSQDQNYQSGGWSRDYSQSFPLLNLTNLSLTYFILFYFTLLYFILLYYYYYYYFFFCLSCLLLLLLSLLLLFVMIIIIIIIITIIIITFAMRVAPSVEAGAEEERTGPPQEGGESSVFVGIMTPISGETDMD